MDPRSIQEKEWIQGVPWRKGESREYPGERMDPESILDKGWIQGVSRRKDGPVEYLGV